MQCELLCCTLLAESVVVETKGEVRNRRKYIAYKKGSRRDALFRLAFKAHKRSKNKVRRTIDVVCASAKDEDMAKEKKHNTKEKTRRINERSLLA